jgi:hypothetical protein
MIWNLFPVRTEGNLFFILTASEYHQVVQIREEVFMEGPIELNMGPSLADVLLCTFENTNTGFSSFPVRKLLS